MTKASISTTKNNRNEVPSFASISTFYHLLLAAMSIGAHVLCCKSILVNSLVGVFLVLVVLPFTVFALYLILYQFFINVSFLFSANKFVSIFLTAAILFTVPMLIISQQEKKQKEFLASYPSNGMISFKVSVDKEITNSSGSIGSEWSYNYFINNKQFDEDQTLEIEVDKPFVISACFIERDSISDIGEAESKPILFSDNQNYAKDITVVQNIHVEENGGRKNKGAFRDYKVSYTLTRIVPDDMSFWDMFMFSEDTTAPVDSIALIVGEVLSLLTIVFVIVKGIKKKTEIKIKMEREEKDRLENEKKEMLRTLEGTNIRNLAGVPHYIKFEGKLPKDNNDAKYGSFTVYRSSSGTCYHRKRGCSSAFYEMHAFDMKKRYSPCSKCCKVPIVIPEWHKNYTLLYDKCKRLGIDINDV